MAYNRKNYINRILYILSVYEQYKFEDVPDSHILRVHFPKHNIFISYRQWMNIKGTPLPRAKLKDVQESLPIQPEYENHLQIVI